MLNFYAMGGTGSRHTSRLGAVHRRALHVAAWNSMVAKGNSSFRRTQGVTRLSRELSGGG